MYLLFSLNSSISFPRIRLSSLYLLFSLELVITVVDLPIENKSQEITVKWLEQPIKTDFYDFFGNNYNNPNTQVNERVQKRMTLYEGILPKNNNELL